MVGGVTGEVGQVALNHATREFKSDLGHALCPNHTVVESFAKVFRQNPEIAMIGLVLVR
jgi:hypothetical protein